MAATTARRAHDPHMEGEKNDYRLNMPWSTRFKSFTEEMANRALKEGLLCPGDSSLDQSPVKSLQGVGAAG